MESEVRHTLTVLTIGLPEQGAIMFAPESSYEGFSDP
jgi:hypothetical protein